MAVDDDGARRGQRQLAAAAAAVAVSGTGAVLRQYLWINERAFDYSKNFLQCYLEQELDKTLLLVTEDYKVTSVVNKKSVQLTQ